MVALLNPDGTTSEPDFGNYVVGGGAMPLTMPDEFNVTTGTPQTGGGGSGTGISASDIIDALARAYSAYQYDENTQDAQDSLSQAIARAAASREGLKADTFNFYDRSAGTLANDIQAWLPFLDDATAGSGRAEQYGGQLVKYVQDAIARGQAGVDSDLSAALGRLGGARDTALGDLAAIFGPAMDSARGELTYQRGLGRDVIDFTRQGAEDARRRTTPLLDATAARYMSPSQYTDQGIRGVLSRAALAGVTDAFDNTQRTAINQAVRSGSGGGRIISDMARERSDATSTALLRAAAESIGKAQGLNSGRRGQEAANYGTLSESLRAREALVPQAYDIASKGSLGAQNLIAALAQAYGGQTGATNNQYMSGITGLSNAGLNAKAGLAQTGATAGAQGYKIAADSALSGDSVRGGLTKALVDNYFAGMRGISGNVMENIRSGWLGDMQVSGNIAPRQAAVSAGRAQADPWTVAGQQLLGGVAGKAIDKGIDWAVDQVSSWF